MVDTDEERTPLQQKLDEFAQQLSKVLWPDIYFQISQAAVVRLFTVTALYLLIELCSKKCCTIISDDV